MGYKVCQWRQFLIGELRFHGLGNMGWSYIYQSRPLIMEARRMQLHLLAIPTKVMLHLAQTGILSSAFTNVDEIRFYKQGGDESWTALNNIKVNSPVISVLATVTTSAASAITTSGAHSQRQRN